MMCLLHWSSWQQNHDLLPTGIKVTNYPSCTQDWHLLEEPTLLFSCGEPLSSLCTFPFDGERWHQHQHHVCPLPSGTMAHLAASQGVQDSKLGMQEAQLMEQLLGFGKCSVRAWVSPLLSSALAAAPQFIKAKASESLLCNIPSTFCCFLCLSDKWST